ncbi:MAG: polysaccharide biosynthesis protein [Sphingomonadales bacterium]
MAMNARDIVNWPRPVKYLLLGLTDLLVVIASFHMAIAVESGNPWPIAQLYESMPFALLAVVIFPLVFTGFHVYRHMVRYAGSVILFEAAKSVTVAVLVTALLSAGLLQHGLPVGALFIFWAYALFGTVGSRLVAKRLITTARGSRAAESERAAIYGAGGGGLELLEALMNSTTYEVVALFDDDLKLSGRRVHNCLIYDTRSLAAVVEKLEIKRIVLAIPSASRRRRVEILTRLEKLGVKVQMLPSVRELIGGKVTLSHVRDVQASDLLWRERHQPNQELLERDIRGKSVMVTGGGGSIGSELCRKAIANGARRLAIVENSEFALYSIEQELRAVIREQNLSVELEPILCDVGEVKCMERYMRRCGTQTVYHAAAYKHVPMVEYNPCEGVKNNVFGTMATARAAIAARVEKFVLISTDKAVRPPNVMGASKRLAEMVLQAIQGRDAGGNVQGLDCDGTRFTMVRFGNVLDSAGSVVPLFRQQIRDGGPITLTHREVTRFFMTIPEAAQLVFQAGAMSKGGEVFLLEMGEPVRIFDLARRMIHLSGLTVADADETDGDIEIEITGMRPGEKLHEELFIGDNVSGTDHPSILRAEEACPSWGKLSRSLNALGEAIQEGNADTVRAILSQVVEGYTPSSRAFFERPREPRLTVVSS